MSPTATPSSAAVPRARSTAPGSVTKVASARADAPAPPPEVRAKRRFAERVDAEQLKRSPGRALDPDPGLDHRRQRVHPQLAREPSDDPLVESPGTADDWWVARPVTPSAESPNARRALALARSTDTTTATPSAIPRMDRPACHGCRRRCRRLARRRIMRRPAPHLARWPAWRTSRGSIPSFSVGSLGRPGGPGERAEVAELDVQALDGRPRLPVAQSGQLDLPLAPVAAVGQVVVEDARVTHELGDAERERRELVEQARGRPVGLGLRVTDEVVARGDAPPAEPVAEPGVLAPQRQPRGRTPRRRRRP